jgi:DNA-binding MarR family transcriptional regulator
VSTHMPQLGGHSRPANLAVLLREAFVALNDLVLAHLAAHGHDQVRPAHVAVFQYLDDTGTTVSALAERAQMTKQAMAELVQHLETHGYVTREPDPADRRAKRVLPTARGHEVIAVAQGLAPDLERRLTGALGADRIAALREDLATIRRVATASRSERAAAPAT